MLGSYKYTVSVASIGQLNPSTVEIGNFAVYDANENPVEITDVVYDFDPENIVPGVYDVTFKTEGYQY